MGARNRKYRRAKTFRDDRVLKTVCPRGVAVHDSTIVKVNP